MFSIVRNPYDRAVSSFFYLNAGGNNPLDEFDRIKYIEKYRGDFDLFVKTAFPHVMTQIHFMPQYSWIYYNDIKCYDFVEKFENLHKYKFLPQLNKSRHTHYLDYYTPETKKIIHHYYIKDFELFNYSA